MSQQVYVPLIVHGREKYEYHAISCGVFTNKNDAVGALLSKLIEHDFLPYNCFLESLEDRKLEYEEENYEENENYKFIMNVDIDNFSQEDFCNYLQEKVNCNESNLEDMCQTYGDSYYKDGWKFQIDEHTLNM